MKTKMLKIGQRVEVTWPNFTTPEILRAHGEVVGFNEAFLDGVRTSIPVVHATQPANDPGKWYKMVNGVKVETHELTFEALDLCPPHRTFMRIK